MRVQQSRIDNLGLQHFVDGDTDGYCPVVGNMQKTLLRANNGMLCSVAKKGLLGFVWWSDADETLVPMTIDTVTGLYVSVNIC